MEQYILYILYFITTSSKKSPFFGIHLSAFSSSPEYSLLALQLRKFQVFILLYLGYLQETKKHFKKKTPQHI